jgi:WD40 repeat protein
MAMEKRLIIRDCHSRAVTAVTFVPWRREYVTAAEDGQMRYWEFDGGKLVQTVNEHGGWVTDIICWVEYKAMFTSSNDGTIIVWSSTGTVHQRIELNHPVYCLAWQLRRSQLIAGMNDSIRAYSLKEGSLVGAPYMEKRAEVLRTHTDIVKCIVCVDAKVYSGGYDQRLVLHEALPGERGLKASNIVKFAHDAGISCMTYARDTENTWIITGAFDHIVKVWSPECKLIHRVTDQSFSVITGLCYVPRNKTVWVSSGNELILIFEPKSGENVSEFISTFRELVRDKEKQTLMALKYVPEASEVVATTKRRQLVIWKHEQTAATVTLPSKKPFECLSYTSKPPILIFSGGGDSQLIKWEQQQLNNFAYSQELFPLNETSMSDGAKANTEKERSRQSSQASDDREADSSSESESDSDISTTERSHSRQRSNHSATKQTAGVTMLRSTYIESLDNLVVGCEDGTIFIWGYDTKAKKALQGMSIAATDPELLKKYGCLLDASSDLLTDKPCSEKEDSVTDRVAGFICRHVLKHHSGSVTGLAVVETDSLSCSNGSRFFPAADTKTYLLSGGWDRNVCLWDIEAGKLVDKVRYQKVTSDNDGEIASDGVITDMAYCSERYSSISDSLTVEH